MDPGDTIHTMPTDDSQFGHMDHIILNDRQCPYFTIIMWIAGPHFFQMATVDLFNDHIDARKQGTEHISPHIHDPPR